MNQRRRISPLLRSGDTTTRTSGDQCGESSSEASGGKAAAQPRCRLTSSGRPRRMPATAVVTLQSSVDHAWHPTAVARGNPMLAGAPKLPPSERSAASVCLPAPVAATLEPVGLPVPVPARQGRLWPARTGSPTITSGVYKTNMQGNISTVFLRAREVTVVCSIWSPLK